MEDFINIELYLSTLIKLHILNLMNGIMFNMKAQSSLFELDSDEVLHG